MNNHLQHTCFNTFDRVIDLDELPKKFTNPFSYKPHPLCVEASKKLQTHLKNQSDWEHNFGLDSKSGDDGIGKMFGVLVVQKLNGEIGFLAAFSGSMGGATLHPGFVPPIFDSMAPDGFLNDGMGEITNINDAIARIKISGLTDSSEQIGLLKQLRKDHSNTLLNMIFDEFYFLNQAGESKSLKEIFKPIQPKNPPGGAGECAAPKLLQFAFTHKFRPIAMAEFWWGKNPNKVNMEHGEYYPACFDKCKPILTHMLEGMVIDEPNMKA